MDPKPVFPVDFGIENLYSEFHGNIVVKLENNAQMAANSMILSYNSPVFGDIFRNLEMRNVDMDDFSGAAVKKFLESLYTGEVELNKQMFREMNKIANVFKVTWLISRCESYFGDLVQIADGTDYESLLFVFEEAIFLKNFVKKPVYLDIVLKKLTSTANIETVFIERYMADYLAFSTNQLDLMIHIAGESVHIFMKILKRNEIVHTRVNLDDNTKYLLQHLDLVKCMEQDKELYEGVFDTLFENASLEDLRMLVNLYREAATGCHLRKRRKIEAPARDIINLFNDFQVFDAESGRNDQLIDELLSSSYINSLHLFFEAVEHGDRHASEFYSWKLLTTDALHKVVEKKQEEGWCAVHPDFLDKLFWLNKNHRNIYARITDCKELVSTTDTVKILCNEGTTAKKLVTEEMTYKFYFQHSKTTSCLNQAQCGFVLKVSPLTKENSGLFNIHVVTDPILYPDYIHHHNVVTSVEKMHITVEWYHEYYNGNVWRNWCMFWLGKPEYNEDRTIVCWGRNCTREKAKAKVRLAIHYNITE